MPKDKVSAAGLEEGVWRGRCQTLLVSLLVHKSLRMVPETSSRHPLLPPLLVLPPPPPVTPHPM